MVLKAIVQREKVRIAFEQFENKLNRGRQYNRILGYQGGSGWYPIRWHAKYGFWHCFEMDEDNSNRYWCAYGLDDPTLNQCLNITCEINIPFEGIRKDIAASFGRRNNGKMYLCHNGKIGGSRKGFKKSAFWTHFGERNAATITYSDITDNEAKYVVSCIDDPNLMKNIADFINEIAILKASIMAANLL